MKFKNGFTLIELLVVIAIVGLLTSIALASLNTARNKAADATIKQNLAQIRAQAQIVYDTYESSTGYESLFDGGPGYLIYIAAFTAAGCIYPNSSCGVPYANEAVGAVPSTWAAWVRLKTNTAQAWCVDYTGFSNIINMSDVGDVGSQPHDCIAGGSS